MPFVFNLLATWYEYTKISMVNFHSFFYYTAIVIVFVDDKFSRQYFKRPFKN